MTNTAMKSLGLSLVAVAALPGAATADNLFRSNEFAPLATDIVASQVGDILTVVVFQAAEARNSARNLTDRSISVGGDVRGFGDVDEFGDVSLSGGAAGRGETRRSESFVTQLSVTVIDVLSNGDLIIEGEQLVRINDETTQVTLRGRVRPRDISGDNRVLSTRIADARIAYDGSGFVTRGASANPISWLFNLFGL